MMACYRIYSTMIDDGSHQADKNTSIVIHAKLNNEGSLDSEMEAFGYSKAWDEESGYQKYPFILKYEQSREQSGKFDFAGWDSETDDRKWLEKPKRHESLLNYIRKEFNKYIEDLQKYKL